MREKHKLEDNSQLTFISFVYILGCCYVALFLFEFFPVKPKVPTTVLEPPKEINGIDLQVDTYYQPEIKRLVFIIIDGLRTDFVNETAMPFLYKSIKGTKGCFIKLRTELPTVTMPRIKAMTTGSVPQFIDLVLNFESKQVTEDSWLLRAKEAGKNIVFYGDDTWLKLYPNMFLRSEGTTSFYVNDFVKVDNNVSRHLEDELNNKNDWDILILHYLGLDHIGHVHGPFHWLIETKLLEMDHIIKLIYSLVEKEESTIIAITGDHGMRDLGGHGGSSDPEIHVPFILLKRPCSTYRKYDVMQSDLAPTIAALFGLPLPAESIGKIIYDLPYRSAAKNLYLYYYNALNLIKLDEKSKDSFQEIFKAHEQYLKNERIHPKNIIDAYEAEISKISENLIKSSIYQHVPLLFFILTNMLVISVTFLVPREMKLSWFLLVLTTLGITLFLLIFRESIFINILIFGYCFIMLSTCLFTIFKVVLNSKLPKSNILWFLLCGTTVRTLAFLSSSFVEEEHQIWYFLSATVTFLGAFLEFKNEKSFMKAASWMGLLIGFRVIRFLMESHLSKWDFVPGQSYFNNDVMLTWTVFLIGLVGVSYYTSKLCRTLSSILIYNLTIAAIFWFRATMLIEAQTVLPARIALVLIILTGIITSIKYHNLAETLTICWILWITLLMQPYNVILIPICLGFSNIIFKICSVPEEIILMHIWFEEFFFFCQGFRNTFSSVDVSAGYIGLTDYSLFHTSFRVICHTYAFRVLPKLLLLCKMNQSTKMLHYFMTYRFFSITFYCFVILELRQHLFIWSVFSPKLLIEGCHCICLLIIVIINFILKMSCRKKEGIIKC